MSRSMLHQRGLAAARAACDADDQIVHVPKSSRLPIPVEKPVRISYNRYIVGEHPCFSLLMISQIHCF